MQDHLNNGLQKGGISQNPPFILSFYPPLTRDSGSGCPDARSPGFALAGAQALLPGFPLSGQQPWESHSGSSLEFQVGTFLTQAKTKCEWGSIL